MSLRLKNKVAIVTGAAAGIGRASCWRFAQEGARVAAVDLQHEGVASLTHEAQASGLEIKSFTCDVSDSRAVGDLMAAVLREFSSVDILFNNAGIVTQGPLHATSEADWDRTFAVNLKSIYLLCSRVVPIFLEKRAGVILNTASSTVLRSVPDRAAYSASKGAIVALTRSMAVDYVRQGIRVNCLCPGTVNTPSLQSRVASAQDPQEAMLRFVARQPMARLGEANEIAEAALYLVSDESSFVTGAAFAVDGGFSA